MTFRQSEYLFVTDPCRLFYFWLFPFSDKDL